MTHLVIDGDLLAFKASAAGEYRYIDVDFPDGTCDTFDNRTALKEHCELVECDYKDCIITDEQMPEPFEVIVRTYHAMIDRILKETSAETFSVYVGKGDSFRVDLPLPEKYKGNREGTIKPVYVDDLKDYIISTSEGNLSGSNLESDDWVCMKQWIGYTMGTKVIAVTSDKDANSQYGWLYNPDKMTSPRFVDGVGELTCGKRGSVWKVEGYGERFLMYQMLTSDSVDNLFPSRLSGVRFGPLKTYELLNEEGTLVEVWQRVVDKYKEWFGDDFKYTTWDGKEINTNWEGVFDLYFACFKMKRYLGDVQTGIQYMEELRDQE